MTRPKFSLRDILAAADKNTASSISRTPATDETDDLPKQLDNARREAQNALAKWRSYPNPYYELAWVGAVKKVQRLEARIPKRKATSEAREHLHPNLSMILPAWSLAIPTNQQKTITWQIGLAYDPVPWRSH